MYASVFRRLCYLLRWFAQYLERCQHLEIARGLVDSDLEFPRSAREKQEINLYT